MACRRLPPPRPASRLDLRMRWRLIRLTLSRLFFYLWYPHHTSAQRFRAANSYSGTVRLFCFCNVCCSGANLSPCGVTICPEPHRRTAAATGVVAPMTSGGQLDSAALAAEVKIGKRYRPRERDTV
jgi:hypothetical protein